MKNSTKVFAVSALAGALAACGGSGGDGGSSGQTGTVSVGLTDAPVDHAEAVNIEVTALVLKHQDGSPVRYELEIPEPVNLLDYQNGQVKALLDREELDAGEYEWVRLEIGENNNIVIDGGEYPLTTPSARGIQTSGFTVPAGGEVAITIDFDVRKSIVNPQNDPNSYKLKPVLRLVDNAQVGTITGAVSAELITEACGGVATTDGFLGNIYVHAGADQTPDDIGSANEPLVVVPVEYGEEYSYQASFIPEGDYTVSYTCDSDLIEDTEGNPSDDELNFTNGQNATVTAGETTTVNF
ncbi:DUF4382 domain-containing protein [Marinobacter sp. P4B1]|uniref:DUF4382 domain-containing protein n=1 Tax=Marinobacter sp. P4B1 TaxID=1119533 RepID=UPI00071D9E24|nr:DUF4382 domain-containing protein [Marinobacter sp. P4B1]KRW83795.1 hypothetical protein AQ621_14705 [Marinobacter sp. P4B1]